MEHQVNVVGGRPGDAERPQGSGVAALGRGGRMSRQRKSAAVLRLLRGEDLETVSRELGVTAATFTNWDDAFLAAGEAALPTRAVTGEELESDRLDTGVIVAAALHPADNRDTTAIGGTVAAAEKNLAQINAAPMPDKPSELVADKGYHSRAVLKDLNGGAWKTRIAEPKQPGFSRWHGDDKARAAVYANRTRLGSG